jgi:hypothetical protein
VIGEPGPHQVTVAVCPLRPESGQTGRRFTKSALCHKRL